MLEIWHDAGIMKWEYTARHHQPDFTKEKHPVVAEVVEEANKLGDDGWELVSVTTDTDKDGRTRGYLYYFKRPKS